MDFVELLSYFRQFNADVLVFGVAAWGLAFLLKKTVFKKAGGKLLAVLPFALGTVLYTAYRLILLGVCNASAEGAFTEGLTCGSFAMAMQVLLTRTAGVSIKAACVQSVLAGYITLSSEQAEELAEAILTDEQKAKEQLVSYVGEAAETYYLLLSETLKTFEQNNGTE